MITKFLGILSRRNTGPIDGNNVPFWDTPLSAGPAPQSPYPAPDFPIVWQQQGPRQLGWISLGPVPEAGTWTYGVDQDAMRTDDTRHTLGAFAGVEKVFANGAHGYRLLAIYPGQVNVDKFTLLDGVTGIHSYHSASLGSTLLLQRYGNEMHRYQFNDATYSTEQDTTTSLSSNFHQTGMCADPNTDVAFAAGSIYLERHMGDGSNTYDILANSQDDTTTLALHSCAYISGTAGVDLKLAIAASSPSYPDRDGIYIWDETNPSVPPPAHWNDVNPAHPFNLTHKVHVSGLRNIRTLDKGLGQSRDVYYIAPNGMLAKWDPIANTITPVVNATSLNDTMDGVNLSPFELQPFTS